MGVSSLGDSSGQASLQITTRRRRILDNAARNLSDVIRKQYSSLTKQAEDSGVKTAVVNSAKPCGLGDGKSSSSSWGVGWAATGAGQERRGPPKPWTQSSLGMPLDHGLGSLTCIARTRRSMVVKWMDVFRSGDKLLVIR